ncbi:MAG: hypothetical protein M1546_05475 [Chloroflexi bacterium]|nr:hypothetical protein [Chloroflexota bacterium]
MAFLTKDQILAVDDRQTEIVGVPEWGGDVLVQGFTGIERDAFEAGVVTQKGKNTTVNLNNLRAKMVARSVVDPESHKRLFTDADVQGLGKKSAAALERVFDVARRLSGMSDNDVEELTKNSGSETNDDSGFVSQ